MPDLMSEPWLGSSIRYTRPRAGSNRQSRRWDIDLGQPIDDLRDDLSTLPLSPPSPVRSLDAFEDSLAQGLRDDENSVRAVLRNWTALRNSDDAYWQMLSRIFFSAVDEAMVGWCADEFPPNREPLPEIAVMFLHKTASDSAEVVENPPDCVAMVGFARAMAGKPQRPELHYSLDLTGCEEFRDGTTRLVECGLVDPAGHAETQKELRQALLAQALSRPSSTLFVHWTGRLSSEHQGRVRQKALERSIAHIFAEVICALEEHARDGSPTLTMIVDVDGPVFNLAAESGPPPASIR